MTWLARLWQRLFQRQVKALPEPKTPLERWQRDYAAWLVELQEVFGRFPDHGVLEGEKFGEADGRLLDDITNLYADQACEVVEQMVLRGEMLRRRVAAKDKR